jgi:nucleotide-binding universal stress UspA family protein
LSDGSVWRQRFIPTGLKSPSDKHREMNRGLVKTIMVGVDGSKHAAAALEFAAEEASLRGARLLVVYAWEIPMAFGPNAVYPSELLQGLPNEADITVHWAVARARELQPQVACEGEAIQGHPAAVLLKEAEHANMIVVGSRGRGGFSSLLLGSVSQQVVHHAPCPVVVVR